MMQVFRCIFFFILFDLVLLLLLLFCVFGGERYKSGQNYILNHVFNRGEL